MDSVEVLSMVYLRRLLVGAVGALTLVGAAGIGASAHEGRTLVEFDSMTPVTGAAVGTVNDRGIKGGGLPWVITSGRGEVDREGHVSVTVRGLIIVVAPVNGINPVPAFKATVSCITPHGVINVSTATAPASKAGDAQISGTVSLPRHCKDPIVFVAAPSGQWFAMSNSEDED
ncbi:MAG: hypothetical protein ACYDAL_06185 [Candidatus Dormibacteraceae bacterium]